MQKIHNILRRCLITERKRMMDTDKLNLIIIIQYYIQRFVKGQTALHDKSFS